MDQATNRPAPTKPAVLYPGLSHADLYRGLQDGRPSAVGAYGDLWGELSQVMAEFSEAITRVAAESESEWQGRSGDGNRRELLVLARKADVFASAAKQAGEMSAVQAEALAEAQRRVPPPPAESAGIGEVVGRIMLATHPIGLVQLPLIDFVEHLRRKHEHQVAAEVVENYDRVLAETSSAPAFAPPAPPPPLPPVDGREDFDTHHGRYPVDGLSRQANDDVIPASSVRDDATVPQGTAVTSPGGGATTTPSGVGQGFGPLPGQGGTSPAGTSPAGPQWTPPGGYAGGLPAGGHAGAGRDINARLGGAGPHTGAGPRGGLSGTGAGHHGGAGGGGAGGPGAARNSSGVLGPHAEAARNAPVTRPGATPHPTPPLGAAAPPAAARNDDDKDHQTAPYLLERDPETLFGNTDPVAPPVIGEW